MFEFDPIARLQFDSNAPALLGRTALSAIQTSRFTGNYFFLSQTTIKAINNISIFSIFRIPPFTSIYTWKTQKITDMRNM